MCKTKVLILIVGESGTGKTSLANYLHKHYGLRLLPSYTTRPKRSNSDTDHTYVTDEEYKKLQNIVAENNYNGYMYCATEEQCDNADVYVVDITGMKKLKQLYKTKRVVSVYLKTSENTRIQRMKFRGDTDEMIMERLKYDRIEFANAECLCDIVIDNEFCMAMTAMLLDVKLKQYLK